MSLATQVVALAQRIATEFKSVRAAITTAVAGAGPNITAGTIPASALAPGVQNAIAQNYVVARKSGQSTITTTTLANDPDLTATVAANASYVGEALIFYTTTINNKAKWALTFPSTAHVAGHILGISSANTTASSATSGIPVTQTNFRSSTSGGPSGAVGGLSSADGTTTVTVCTLHVWFELVNGSTAGNLVAQFAENASTDATGLVILSDSRLSLTRVA